MRKEEAMSEKPSNKIFRLARTRFDEEWVDLSEARKITILLDLLDELHDTRWEP